MAAQTISDTATDQARQVTGTARAQTTEVASHAADAATSVAGTAKEQLSAVTDHAVTQGQQLAEQAQHHVGAEAERQASSLADNIRSLTNELQTMARAGSRGHPARTLLSTLASKGEDVAALLDREGPDGLIREAQNLGRRRPGAFLLSALAAGFATTRLAKHASKVSSTEPAAEPYPSGRGGR